MSNVTVEVTQEDIDRATRLNSSKCAVATAVARSVKDAKKVSVDIQTVRLTRGNKRYVYLTPRSVQEYIVAFDAGDAIPPFTVRLRGPHITEMKTRTKATIEQPIAPSLGTPVQRPVRAGGKTPPVQGTTKMRTYGMRFMRINQDG